MMHNEVLKVLIWKKMKQKDFYKSNLLNSKSWIEEKN